MEKLKNKKKKFFFHALVKTLAYRVKIISENLEFYFYFPPRQEFTVRDKNNSIDDATRPQSAAHKVAEMETFVFISRWENDEKHFHTLRWSLRTAKVIFSPLTGAWGRIYGDLMGFIDGIYAPSTMCHISRTNPFAP